MDNESLQGGSDAGSEGVEAIGLDLVPLPITFQTDSEYRKIFMAFLIEEDMATETRRMAFNLSNITVSFDLDELVAEFDVPSDFVIERNDALKFVCHYNFSTTPAVATASVNSSSGGHIVARLNRIRSNFIRPFNKFNQLCDVEGAVDGINYSRCLLAVELFREILNGNIVAPRRLSHGQHSAVPEIPIEFCKALMTADESYFCHAPQIPHSYTVNLNESQHHALQQVHRRRLTLVQGPPGTGKTHLSSAIVQSFVNAGKRVLIASQSNLGADNVMAKVVHLMPSKVIRFSTHMSQGRENLDLVDYYLPQMMEQDAESGNSTFYRVDEYLDMYQRPYGILSGLERKKFDRVVFCYRRYMLDQFQVVVSTSVGAGHKAMRFQHFDLVVIDEATKDTEPTSLIPLLRLTSTGRAVLIGDTKQLCPTILSKLARQRGYATSLFERIIRSNHVPEIMLKIQYRMWVHLMTYSNDTFYNGILRNGVPNELREEPSAMSLFWNDRDDRTLFYQVNTLEQSCESEREGDVLSPYNVGESEKVVELVQKMILSNVTEQQITILTAYRGQQRRIRSDLARKCLAVAVSTIDAFQGKENRYIIWSLTRSNMSREIGFMDDERRINVAFTRAQYGLVLVGNLVMFETKQHWARFINHFKTSNLIVGSVRGVCTGLRRQHQIDCFNPVIRNLPRVPRMRKEKYHGSIDVDESVVGCIIGLNGETERHLFNQYGVSMSVTPRSQRDGKLVRAYFSATSPSNLTNGIGFACRLIEKEHERRLVRDSFRKPEDVGEHKHPLPRRNEWPSLFYAGERLATSREYFVRHDVAGIFLDRDGSYSKQFCQNTNCFLLMGEDREFRILIVVAANGRANLDLVDVLLRQRFESEMNRRLAGARFGTR